MGCQCSPEKRQPSLNREFFLVLALFYHFGSSLHTQVSLSSSLAVLIVHKAATFGLRGILLSCSGLSLPSSYIPTRGIYTCSTHKTPPVLGRAQLGRWGCPGSPSQVMSCCFQVAEYPNTHRLLTLGAFHECFPRFCLFFRALTPRIRAGTSSCPWRLSCAPFPPSPPSFQQQ